MQASQALLPPGPNKQFLKVRQMMKTKAKTKTKNPNGNEPNEIENKNINNNANEAAQGAPYVLNETAQGAPDDQEDKLNTFVIITY
jgi:hypothetical protein